MSPNLVESLTPVQSEYKMLANHSGNNLRPLCSVFVIAQLLEDRRRSWVQSTGDIGMMIRRMPLVYDR